MTTATATTATQSTAAKKQTNSGKGKNNNTAPLKKFFIDALKDTLWAEKAIIKGLQKMQDSASSEELIEAFEDHEWQTQKHIKRLEKVFKLINEEVSTKKCAAMEGLLKEAEEIIAETPEGSATRDATLIIAAQKIEHYEIASYGGLVQIASTLELDEAARLLEKTLEEEEDTDLQLTDIAESSINFEAGEEDEQAA